MSILHRLVAVAGLIAAGSLLGTTVGAQATEHCPDHQGHPGKVENVDTPSVHFDAGTVFCVKAGPYATGIIDDWEGGTYTTPAEWHPLGTEPIDISYYVVYDVPGNGDNGNGDNGNGDNGNGNGDNGDNGDNGNGNGDNGNGTVPETPEPQTPEPEAPEPETPVTPEPDTEQLPPPGTEEPATAPPEPEPVQLPPPAPEVGADPPPAAEPEVTDLPETGAALAVTAGFALALLAFGVALRRFARPH